MGILGVFLGFVYLLFACRKNKKSLYDALYIYTFAGLGAIWGAKVLYLIIESRNIISLLSDAGADRLGIILAYLRGGMVLYGGLFGWLLGILLATKLFKSDAMTELNFFMPAFALIHGCMRIGCGIVGCCYGKARSGALAITYTHSDYAPSGVELIPIQFIESLFVFTLFAVMIFLMQQERFQGKNLYIYLTAYAVARFIFEFMRGDSARGSFLGLSTSQWFGLIILATEAIYLIGSYKNKENKSISATP